MKRKEQRSFLVLLLLLVGLALLPPPSGAAAKSKAGLNQRQRMRIFDQVWKTINTWYCDPTFGGVDWKAVGNDFRQRAAAAADDEAFHALIAEMLARLNDTHTFYEPPVNSLLARHGAAGRGLAVAEIEGRFVVTAVDPELAALHGGIRPGLVLVTIDGQPVATRARAADAVIRRTIGLSSEKILAYFRRQLILDAPAEQPMTLAFVDPMGHPVEARIERALATRREPPVSSRRLASGLGYVRWTTWDPALTTDIRTHLAALGDVPGLIIDLRGNPGGDPQLAVDVLSCLVEGAVPHGTFHSHRQSPRKVKTHPCPRTYRGPLAVLINGESGSTSEIFANLIQEIRRGLVIGQPSAASVFYHLGERVQGGGQLWISLWEYTSPQGRRLQGTGVAPDLVAETTLAGLWEGRDEILEAAEAALSPRAVRATGFPCQSGPPSPAWRTTRTGPDGCPWPETPSFRLPAEAHPPAGRFRDE